MSSGDGLVRRVEGGVYEVELPDGAIEEAVLRGRLKLEERTGDRVVVGDRVRLSPPADGFRAIEAVEPRSSVLARRAPGRSRAAKAIVANLDQLCVVLSASKPVIRLGMLDRFLVLAEANGLPAIIVVNKVDEAAEVPIPVLAPYGSAGYPVLHTSAVSGEGLAELRGRLCGRMSVLGGQSGVGKSSLLNAMQPGLGLRVADVRAAAGKGRHTTVTARLIPLECGGYVADTPGLRELGLWGVETEELDRYFPELRDRIDDCRFAGSCTHTHEPDCAVREAVAGGEIDEGRYRRYCALLESD